MPNSAFGFSKPEDSAGFLLWQTTITWQRLIKKALDSYKVSHAQFVIMAILLWHEEKDKPATQALIVSMTKLDKMTVSKSLKKLATQGLVKRFEYEKDTRAKLVHLTNKGRKLAGKLVPIVENIDEEFFRVLNFSEHKSLLSILYKLIINQQD